MLYFSIFLPELYISHILKCSISPYIWAVMHPLTRSCPILTYETGQMTFYGRSPRHSRALHLTISHHTPTIGGSDLLVRTWKLIKLAYSIYIYIVFILSSCSILCTILVFSKLYVLYMCFLMQCLYAIYKLDSFVVYGGD